jgi:hypothetical protein
MSKSDWITAFKALFPEFVPILNESSEDVTDATIQTYLDITMDILPQNIIEYLSRASMENMLYYATAHMLSYYNVKDGYAESRTLSKNVTSMSAQGLSTSFESVARMKNDIFSSLNDFFNTTAYGRAASLYLEKMSGTVGGYVV